MVLLVSNSPQPDPGVNRNVETIAFCLVPTKTGHVKNEKTFLILLLNSEKFLTNYLEF